MSHMHKQPGIGESTRGQWPCAPLRVVSGQLSLDAILRTSPAFGYNAPPITSPPAARERCTQ